MLSNRTILRNSKNAIIVLLFFLLSLGFSWPAAADELTSTKTIPAVSVQLSDIQGNWAAAQIIEWQNKGLVKGYQDNTFKPNQQVSRAEFMTMANRAFAFTATVPVQFRDLAADDWFAGEVAKAYAAAYISGYQDGTVRPYDAVTRQEAATMLIGISKLQTSNDTVVLSKFKDAGDIPEWSKAGIAAVVNKNIMQGYPDQTFQATRNISRAEAIVTLNNAINAQVPAKTGKVFNKAGTYGSAASMETIDGDVTISVSGVTLQNIQINGSLLLAEGIGNGDVTLKKVKVQGTSTIKGGGDHSVTLEDCILTSITINKEGIRVVASGNTSVGTVQLGSGAALIESNSSGPGFEKVSLADTIPAGSKVSLSGSFSEVNVEAAKVNLAIATGSIARMEVAAKASSASINVASDARISTLTLNAAVSVTGRGTIDTAKVSVAGTTFEQKPTAIENPNNVSINTGVSTSGGSGGGSGTGSGSGNNPLSFVSSDPADGSTGISSAAIIKLTFDRGVVRDYWDNNQSCISMQDSSGQAVAIMVYRATNYLDDSEKENIYVAPNSSLTAGSSYTLTVSAGLKANNGNTLGTAKTITFTVAASSGGGGGGSGTGGGSGNNPLGFVSADPADGSTDLSTTPTIKLTFDRGVAGDYWDNNQTCFSMNDSSGQAIAIMVTRATNYEEDSEKCNIYVTPASSLTAGSSYTLTVAAGLKANNGNTLGTAKTITFTVAGSSNQGTLGISDGDGRSGLNAKAANGPADGAHTGCNVMAFKLTADAVEDIIISMGNNISIAMSNIGGLAQEDLTNIELFTDPNGDGSTDDGALVAVGMLGSVTEGNGLVTFNLSSQQTIAASGYINYILQFDTTANWGDNDTFTLASDSISINASGGTSQQAANVTGSITQRNFVNPVDSAGVPVYQSSEVSNQGDVGIYFSENMESTLALAGKEGQFTVLVNEEPVTVTALQLTSTTTKIKLVLASKVSNGQSVTVAYTKDADANKQVKSSGGGVLESFSAKPVTNNL